MKKKTKTILGAMMLCIITISACKKETNPSDVKPIACFTASRDTILIWDTIQLNASCTKGATSYKWEEFFGGYRGTLSSYSGDKSVFRPYDGEMNRRGDFEIRLTVTNTKGIDTIIKKMFIRAPRPIEYVASYACFDSCIGGSRSPDYTTDITANGNNSITLTGWDASPVNADVISSGGFQITSGSSVGSRGTMVLDNNQPTNQKVSLLIPFASSCYTYGIRK